MRRGFGVVFAVVSGLLFANVLWAKSPKAGLKSNYQLYYFQTPKNVENIADMLREGIFYGRLRSNSFLYLREEENSKQKNSVATGIGGSLILQSALYRGVDFRAGVYYSRGFTSLSEEEAGFMKSSTDILSRFDYINDGSTELASLAQLYLRYSGIEGTEIIVGRQLIESFFAKSNDSKMIPNAFEGVSLRSELREGINLFLAYLTKEKLRGHKNFHSALMYGDENLTDKKMPQWYANDDSVMHKGLTYTRLKNAGIDTTPPLILGDLCYKHYPRIKLNTSFYDVRDLLSSVRLEANYVYPLADDVSVVPGVRYIRQFDNGAGAIGGAAYDGTPDGYNHPDSLDGEMIGVRVVTNYLHYKLNLAYTYVLDEADLITPWRGFPTAGYTRSMGRYNWMANTRSYRIELVMNQNPQGIYKDLYVQTSFLHTDADEKKGFYDENYYYLGLIQNVETLPALQWRWRLGYNDTKKPDADSIDMRFELNYLF